MEESPNILYDKSIDIDDTLIYVLDDMIVNLGIVIELDLDTKKLTDPERWRIAVFVNMVLVDIFDTYDKVERDFVDKSQLDMRMHMLKLGTMKTDIAKVTWNYWKKTRSQNFIDWFEKEIYDEAVSEEGFDKNIFSNLRRN